MEGIKEIEPIASRFYGGKHATATYNQIYGAMMDCYNKGAEKAEELRRGQEVLNQALAQSAAQEEKLRNTIKTLNERLRTAYGYERAAAVTNIFGSFLAAPGLANSLIGTADANDKISDLIDLSVAVADRMLLRLKKKPEPQNHKGDGDAD